MARQNLPKATFKSEKGSKFQQDFSAIFASEIAIFGPIFATYVVNLLQECKFLSLIPLKNNFYYRNKSSHIMDFYMHDLAIFFTIKRISSDP